MEPILRSAQVLKQEAEDLGFEGKEILDYVKEQQKLDREERADESHIKIQIAQIEAAKEQAKIEAEKELALKELEFKAQQNQASASLAATPPLVIKMPSPRSYLLLLMRRTNLTVTCYALNATLKMPVGRRKHGLLS